jgi:hypothetical protein
MLDKWKKLTDRPVHRVEVWDEETKKFKSVLTWYSLAERESLFGRATRAFPCVDPDSDQLYFLKDYWRHQNTTSETTFLKQFAAAEINNVPTVVCGGDLPDQTTKSQQYRSAPWCATTAKDEGFGRKRIHHRVLTKEIAFPLSSFKSTKQLHSVVLDALKGQ